MIAIWQIPTVEIFFLRYIATYCPYPGSSRDHQSPQPHCPVTSSWLTLKQQAAVTSVNLKTHCVWGFSFITGRSWIQVLRLKLLHAFYSAPDLQTILASLAKVSLHSYFWWFHSGRYNFALDSSQIKSLHQWRRVTLESNLVSYTLCIVSLHGLHMILYILPRVIWSEENNNT